jgi:hypothetical protein
VYIAVDVGDATDSLDPSADLSELTADTFQNDMSTFDGNVFHNRRESKGKAFRNRY